ncbi:imidazole glycerol phosphate synthase subunit HisH [Pelomicrobium sp.]|jgi:glutamine amidotransferase|uniref:imidazole glycerol phosphate synthase subunit HisH n=1 Tax=Pelomicrobium sp. TaxID=2815319 RepID=UPI002FDE3201
MSAGRIAVVDYGMGNLRSVAKALEHVSPDARVEITRDPAVVEAADRVVFPGQGAMPDCMRELTATGLREAVVAAAREKPFLGICIGLQMLFEWSEEGNVAGLAVLPGKVLRFPSHAMVDAEGRKLKVPHMGWNQVYPVIEHPLWRGIPTDARFYFVHSYYPEPGDPGLVAAYSLYPFAFTCAVAHGNVFAVQFHPEKSQAVGLQLLANFIAWDGRFGGSAVPLPSDMATVRA